MRSVQRLCLVGIILVSQPGSAGAQESAFRSARFEIGYIDDRFMMILTQTAPLVQQFTGMTAAALLPCLGVDLGHTRLDWTLAAELGLAFDSTGLARWFVRSSEQAIINQRTGRNDPAPTLTADLLFGTPLYLPLRLRTGAELRLFSFLRLQIEVEAAAVILAYGTDLAALRSDFGLTFGPHFTIGHTCGFGLRGRIISFGDVEDRWPGFGATLYLSFPPFRRRT